MGVREGSHRLPLTPHRKHQGSLNPEHPKYKEGVAPPQPQQSLCPSKLRGGRFYHGHTKSQPQTIPHNICPIRRHIYSFALRHMVTHKTCQVPFQALGIRSGTRWMWSLAHWRGHISQPHTAQSPHQKHICHQPHNAMPCQHPTSQPPAHSYTS